MKTVTPRNRKAWRSWLESRHDRESEVWLVFYKRGSGRATISYDDAVEEAICFGWIDGVKRSLDDQRYTHRFSPRKRRSRWSPTNRKRARKMIRAGQMTPAGLMAIERAKRNGDWQPSTETVDQSVSKEFADALHRQQEAAAFFESLTPAQQGRFAAWINAAKRVDTQQRRIAEAIALLEDGRKLGMR